MKRVSMAGALAAFAVAVAAYPAAADQAVALRFAGEFNGQAFSCESKYDGIGSTGSTVEVADYRLFVSDLTLVRADGALVPVNLDQDGKWQTATVALLDFENGTGRCSNGTRETNTVVRGRVPDGTYTGVRFKIGVPFELNHGDPTLQSSPLNLTAMFWNWRGGYKFVKVDLATTGRPMSAAKAAHSGGAHGSKKKMADKAAHGGKQHGGSGHGKGRGKGHARGWSLHLGSTVCGAPSPTTRPASCDNPNRIDVAFEAFDLGRNVVVIDPARVLSAANVDSNAPDTSPGCMSFPGDADCMTVMPRLGIAYGGQPAENQALVSMR